MPYHSTMEKEIAKAAGILDSCFFSTISADSAIPAELIRNAAGLAFLTVIKAGLVWTGKMGTGVVIARLADGSCAVKTFKKGTQVSVGAALDLAVGPVGRSAGTSVNAGGGGVSGNYTYSHAKGVFAGAGLHGSTFLVRGEMNSQFYGRKITPNEILSGQVAPPLGSCDVLFDAIRRACNEQGLSGRNMNLVGARRTSISTSYHGSNETPDATDHAAAAHATSLVANRSSLHSSSYREQHVTPSSTSTSLAITSTVQPDPNDPRIRRYSSYKSERELYAQFEQRKSGVVPPAPTESTHSHPTNPSLKYKSYPAPTPNAAYTAPAQAQAMYDSFVKPSTPKAPQQPVPPLPPPAKGAEMKQVYSNVMNFVQTNCSYAKLQVFKDNCRLFGQDAMSLDAFFSYLLSICSHALMKDLVPQLVRLLPTQEKRERLWTLYVREVLVINI
ncbi:unnamed protein product [Peronospora destructor]|uniref:Ysc84 actin-binding domain-containing protein n=1 Tax=Peronospora destructor TaxID=86335 RepID=A0AAV0V4U7_9STRA|nr:unnamed protein product [Peronospora destructor]